MRVLPVNIVNYNSYDKKQSKNEACKINFQANNIKNAKNIKNFDMFLNSTLATLIVAFGLTIKPYINKVNEENPKIEPLIEKFETKEGALNYSIERIAGVLNEEYPREYKVKINDKNNKILSERLGQENSVAEYPSIKDILSNFVPNYSYTTLHGHPAEKNGATQTFSFQDFKMFIKSDKCSVNYVINKDKKFCKMEKLDNYKKPTAEEMKKIEEDFWFAFQSSRARTKSVYNKENELLIELTDLPNMHRFWDDVTKKYGIKYTTTFGTYGLHGDIYKDDYVYALDNRFEIVDMKKTIIDAVN